MLTELTIQGIETPPTTGRSLSNYWTFGCKATSAIKPKFGNRSYWPWWKIPDSICRVTYHTPSHLLTLGNWAIVLIFKMRLKSTLSRLMLPQRSSIFLLTDDDMGLRTAFEQWQARDNVVSAIPIIPVVSNLPNPKSRQNSMSKQAHRRARQCATAATHSTSTLSWRNRRTSWLSSAACIFMITIPPFLTVFSWVALEFFDGSLLSAMNELQDQGFFLFLKRFAPEADMKVSIAYLGWVLFQAILYTVLPGRSTGQLTASGRLLAYRTNGFLSWLIAISAFSFATFFRFIDPSTIARHWGGLIVIFNIYGYLLSVVAYIKAYFAPSHIEDRNFSGN